MRTKKQIMVLLTGLFALLASPTAQAQCAMCRAVLESEESGITAEAVNDGIVYLMIFPYLLVAIVGVIVYRIMNKEKDKK